MSKNTFNLSYAPHLGSFSQSAGNDPIDQINYLADLGFKALEDNGFAGPPIDGLYGIGMMNQSDELLDKIGATLAKRDMQMGTFVMGPVFWPPNAAFTSGNVEWRQQFLDNCHKAVNVAKRINAKFITIVPDAAHNSLPRDIQTANVVECLRRAADILEPHGITMILEPLSFPPAVYLKTSAECYLLAKAVGRKSCKILFDMYHLQHNEGKIIQNIDLVWDEIGYFQIGDLPGRCEPGTGEINFKNILKHIYKKSKEQGKDFIFGMEHSKSIKGLDGEKALLNAYKEVDNFI